MGPLWWFTLAMSMLAMVAMLIQVVHAFQSNDLSGLSIPAQGWFAIGAIPVAVFYMLPDSRRLDVLPNVLIGSFVLAWVLMGRIMAWKTEQSEQDKEQVTSSAIGITVASVLMMAIVGIAILADTKGWAAGVPQRLNKQFRWIPGSWMGLLSVVVGIGMGLAYTPEVVTAWQHGGAGISPYNMAVGLIGCVGMMIYGMLNPKVGGPLVFVYLPIVIERALILAATAQGGQEGGWAGVGIAAGCSVLVALVALMIHRRYGDGALEKVSEALSRYQHPVPVTMHSG